MAKTIKFNLICDGNPVRTIEDLQNNFSIEDVLEYYNNGLLQRWLEVRGYAEELKKVNGIMSDKPIEIIKELIKIFCVVCDEKKIEESVYMLEYLEKRKKLLSVYDHERYRVKAIISNHNAQYKRLVDGILDNPNDIAKIKANISEIVTNYYEIFQINRRELFYILKDKSVLAIMCLLMNKNSRIFYLPTFQKDGSQVFYWPGIIHTKMPRDYEEMYNNICSLIKEPNFMSSLGENLFSFAGVTDGYWKDLEPKGQKYMIISMDEGDFVRSAGDSGGDLSSADIKNKFVIVDGIDYKSNSSTHMLLYMEV